ncbi:MAG: tail fiber domain-containing protein [Clostridiales bacterium]|nr:tail fiber domain-containing protein [Clostridiales bacterium]
MYTNITNAAGEALADLALFDSAVTSAGRQIDVLITIGDTTYTADDLNNFQYSFDGDILTAIMTSCTIGLKGIKSIDTDTIDSVKFGVYIPSLDDYYYIDYGQFYVDTNDADTAYSDDTKTLNLICYDAMLKTMVSVDLTEFADYASAATDDTGEETTAYLIDPLSAVNIICQRCNLNCKTDGVSSGFTFDMSLFDGYTYRDVLNAVGGACGGFFYVESGCLTFAKLSASGFEANADNLTTLSLSDVRTITSVDFIGSADAFKYPEAVTDDDMVLQISENLIIQYLVDYGKTAALEFVQTCYENIIGLEFEPFEMSCYGYPRLKIGDTFTVVDTESASHTVWCFHSSLTVNQGLTQIIYYDEPEMAAQDYGYVSMTEQTLSNAVTAISRLNGKITLCVTEDELASEISQLADSISLSVTGSLGNTASITISVNGSTSTGTVDMSDVRQAFADDDSEITISAGTITFNSDTFVVNSSYFTVTSAGVINATRGTLSLFRFTDSEMSADLIGDGLTDYRLSQGIFKARVSNSSQEIRAWFYADTEDYISSVNGRAAVFGNELVDLRTNATVCITNDTAGTSIAEFATSSITLYNATTIQSTLVMGNSIYMPNNCSLWGKDTAGNNVILAAVNSSNQTLIGNTTLPTYIRGTEISLQATTNINASAYTRTITPASNATYGLGVSGSLGWSNIYLGNAASTTNALRIIISSTNYMLIGRNTSDRIQVGNTTYPTYMYGSTIYMNGSAYSSDRRMKESITAISENDKYEAFFDNLTPVTYRYKSQETTEDGENTGSTSGRLHVGYIAQDVLSALESAGLSSKDFAGYVDLSLGDGGEDMLCLRYSEFIALNSYMIQKLKSEIADLKNTLSELKEGA